MATIFVTTWIFPGELFAQKDVSEVVISNEITHTTKSVKHPLVQLFSAQPTFSVTLAIFFLVVIIAPLSEELLWRGVIQRVCVRYEYAILRRKLFSRHMRGGISVVGVAILFAALHFHGANTSLSIATLWRSLILACFTQTLFVVLGVFYLVQTKHLTRQTISRTLVFFRKDILHAANWWWIIPLVFGVQLLLVTFFPDTLLPPIPLFPLAVALGILAWKTNRLTASILLHSTFNAISFIMMLMST